MGIADRARDALRPTNSIEAVPEPAQATRRGLHGASPGLEPTAPAAAAPEPATTPQRTAPATKQPAYASEPESIAKRYYVEDKNGERNYFDDYKRSALAMRATDTVVSSKREDLNTVKAMLEIAESRGWRSLEIRGSADFRREAWIEATVRGIEGRGFAATDVDRQEADRRRAERGLPNEVRAAAEPQASQPAAEDKAAATPEQAETQTKEVPVVGVQATKAQTPSASIRDTPTAGTPGRAAAPVKDTLAVAVESPTTSTTKTKDTSVVAVLEPAAVPVKGSGEPTKNGPAEPGVAASRKAVRDAEKDLSPDGRLILAALSEKIDREMNRHNSATKAELKGFVAAELVKKEWAQGPIVLSADQKRAATAPEPVQSALKQEPMRLGDRAVEAEAPRRGLGR